MLSQDDRKESDVILISKWGQTIRLSLHGMRTTSRVTQWIILTKVKASGDMIVRASVVRQGEEEDE
jgi:DNA gyrase subunit A